jgi:hypothetical protein
MDVSWWKSTEVSEEYTASIFSVEECANQLLAGFLLGLLLNPNDGGDMFLQTFGLRSLDYISHKTEVIIATMGGASTSTS